ncbi:MAG: [acyl-carrier-protein] S-malonyltransferase [Bacteroidota bacterium]|nr:[acyl-carrier-protein] S-malonyltransferase [Bacteroidota bacterium]
MKTALLFSGQGSQYVGMLKDIYELYPEAKKLIEHADSLFEEPLSSICFEGPLDKLKETRYTQPALFLHSAVLFELLKGKIEFHAAAGHSVGEYAALYSAGVLSFDEAFNLVSLRGKLMFRAGEYEPGAMFAVLGLAQEKVVETAERLTETGAGNVVVAANFNSPQQIVVSGSAEYLRSNVSAFKQAGAKLVKELVVSGAFHSPLMKPAKDELEKAIYKSTFSNAVVPVYSNALAQPLTDAVQIKEALIAQLTSPVLWSQSLIEMQSNGITKFIEIGPGTVLQGLVKNTLKDVEFSGFDKSADFEKI